MEYDVTLTRDEVLDLLLLLGSISLHIHDDIKPSIESIREKLKELRV
jgi:hypothetical protein